MYTKILDDIETLKSTIISSSGAASARSSSINTPLSTVITDVDAITIDSTDTVEPKVVSFITPDVINDSPFYTNNTPYIFNKTNI